MTTRPEQRRSYTLCLLRLAHDQEVVERDIREVAHEGDEPDEERVSKTHATEVHALIQPAGTLLHFFEDLLVACGQSWRKLSLASSDNARQRHKASLRKPVSFGSWHTT